MKEFEYFKINSIEELKQAYYIFEDKWDKDYSLEEEIILFSNYDYRYVLYGMFGIYLGDDIKISSYAEINNPIKNINNLNKLI